MSIRSTSLMSFFIILLMLSAPTNSQSPNSDFSAEDASASEKLETKYRVNNIRNMQNYISNELEGISGKIEEINKKVDVLRKEQNSFQWISPGTNFMAVIIGALIGVFLSIKIQERQTKFEISKSLMDWKVKQLSELYGPLYALLHQSNAVYRQMNIVLSKSNTSMFRIVDDSDKADFDKKIFEVFDNGEWVIFRTITHINKVYGRSYGVEAYFDELLDIGERMVGIVENKAGYVREDQPELADVFGKYLAHYTLLRQLHKKMKDFLEREGSTTVQLQQDMPVDYTAAFPREIQALVQEGYQKLNIELNSWGKMGSMSK